MYPTGQGNMEQRPGNDEADVSMEKTITRVYNPSMNIGRLDVLALFLTLPFLLAPGFFPTSLSGLALLLLLLPFLSRLARGERLTRPTAANLPIAMLGLVFLPLAFLLSPAPWSITWVRITTLAWSIALYFTLVNNSSSNRDLDLRVSSARLTQLYLALGLSIAVIGLVGMRSVSKLFFVPQTGALAGVMGWGEGLPTNEIAGVLTLFIPFVIALIYGYWIAGSRRSLLVLLPLMAVMTGTMILAQSRTAMMATAVGTVLGLIASGAVSRKWILGGLVAVVVAGAFIATQTPAMEWFVLAGTNSWESVVGPRLGIWHQAAFGIRDHPLWGMGFGLFGSAARLIYPLVPPELGAVVEDAHNLYLQTALDFGLAGLFILLVIVLVVAASAIQQMRERPPRSLDRLWSAGLLGALIAHMLYSLTDSVSLGTLGGIPLWFLFGLVMSASRPQINAGWTKNRLVALTVGLSLVVLAAFSAYPVNHAGQLAVRALADPLARSSETTEALGRLANQQCRAHWYEGLVYDMTGDLAGRAASWGALLNCSAGYTGFMSLLVDDDVELARLAIASQPKDAAGYFWLAGLTARESPADAVAFYERGLELDPGNGRQWLALAELLRPVDETAALDAYLQACLHGDPGANGCLNAGDLAQTHGDTQSAIDYYRLSKYDEARTRADELERLLSEP